MSFYSYLNFICIIIPQLSSFFSNPTLAISSGSSCTMSSSFLKKKIIKHFLGKITHFVQATETISFLTDVSFEPKIKHLLVRCFLYAELITQSYFTVNAVTIPPRWIIQIGSDYYWIIVTEICILCRWNDVEYMYFIIFHIRMKVLFLVN